MKGEEGTEQGTQQSRPLERATCAIPTVLFAFSNSAQATDFVCIFLIDNYPIYCHHSLPPFWNSVIVFVSHSNNNNKY
jgi:hypothetical protein